MIERAAEVAHELPEDDPRQAQTLNKLGVVRGRQGRYAEAERLLKRAVGIAERSSTLSGSELPTYLYNLGTVYRLSARKPQARALFEHALRAAEEAHGPQSLPVAWVLDQIGDTGTAEGDMSCAFFALRRALAIKEEVLGADHWDVAVTLGKLADVYFKQGRYNEAEPFLVRVITIRERVLGWGDPAMARPLVRLAHLYSRQRKHARAEQIVRYSLTLFSNVLASDHPDIIGCLNLLAEIYRGLSRYGEADAVWQVGARVGRRLRGLSQGGAPRLSAPAAHFRLRAASLRDVVGRSQIRPPASARLPGWCCAASLGGGEPRPSGSARSFHRRLGSAVVTRSVDEPLASFPGHYTRSASSLSGCTFSGRARRGRKLASPPTQAANSAAVRADTSASRGRK